MYLDNIIPNSSSVRKSAFYFLSPGYWIGKGGSKVEEGGICSCTSSAPQLEDLTLDDEDVLEEENVVKQQATGGSIDSNIAVQIRGLVKMQGLWVNFPKDQFFCLLGPNGAGKTTVINCLTGVTPVTDGDALIYGYSIRSSVGITSEK